MSTSINLSLRICQLGNLSSLALYINNIPKAYTFSMQSPLKHLETEIEAVQREEQSTARDVQFFCLKAQVIVGKYSCGT